MWTYNNEPFNNTPEEYQGFVYEITELNTGRKYIGKKNFWKPKILPITKSRKRRKRLRVESDWKSYYSSSKEIQSLIEEKVRNRFKMKILRLFLT